VSNTNRESDMYDPLTELSHRLQGRNLSEVARRAGMAYDNVHRLAHRRQDDIYIRTYVKLLKVLDEMDGEASTEVSK